MTSIHDVLVASDLTVGSELALKRTVGLCGDCNVTLLHVLPVALSDPLRPQLHRIIEGYLADLAMHTSGAADNTVHPVIATGHSATTIVTEAVAHHAQLIVLGESAVLRCPSLFVGTTAANVVRLTDRPVLMVKRAGSGPYQRAIVAIDGSPAASRALRMAVALAPEADLRMVYADTVPPTNVEVKARSLREIKERITAEVAGAFAESALPRGNILIEILETSPYSALRHASEAGDLLVMGTHSKAFWATSLELGSLAHHMLAESVCDVLVSPP